MDDPSISAYLNGIAVGLLFTNALMSLVIFKYQLTPTSLLLFSSSTLFWIQLLFIEDSNWRTGLVFGVENGVGTAIGSLSLILLAAQLLTRYKVCVGSYDWNFWIQVAMFVIYIAILITVTVGDMPYNDNGDLLMDFNTIYYLFLATACWYAVEEGHNSLVLLYHLGKMARTKQSVIDYKFLASRVLCLILSTLDLMFICFLQGFTGNIPHAQDITSIAWAFEFIFSTLFYADLTATAQRRSDKMSTHATEQSSSKS